MALTHREEKILEAVVNGSSVPFDPITRREKIFAKAAGEDITLAPPITKEEQILSALAAKDSGGGGSSDFSTAEVTLNANVSGVGDSDNYIRLEGFTAVIENEFIEPVDWQIRESVSGAVMTVVLYKNSAGGSLMDYSSSLIENVEITGNGTYDDGLLNITGDCTINITAVLGGTVTPGQ